MALLLASIDLRTAKVFLPDEPFLVSSNFRRASLMQGGISHSAFANGPLVPPKSHAKWTLRVTLPIIKSGHDHGTTQMPVMETKDSHTSWRPKFTIRNLLQMKLRHCKTHALCESLSPLSMLFVRRNNSEIY